MDALELLDILLSLDKDTKVKVGTYKIVKKDDNEYMIEDTRTTEDHYEESKVTLEDADLINIY